MEQQFVANRTLAELEVAFIAFTGEMHLDPTVQETYDVWFGLYALIVEECKLLSRLTRLDTSHDESSFSFGLTHRLGIEDMLTVALRRVDGRMAIQHELEPNRPIVSVMYMSFVGRYGLQHYGLPGNRMKTYSLEQLVGDYGGILQSALEYPVDLAEIPASYVETQWQ